MSAVCLLVPAVVAGWPAISAAAAGAAAMLGLHAVDEVKETIQARAQTKVENQVQVELELEHSAVVGEQVHGEQAIRMEANGMQVKVFRDERGQVRCCVSGAGRSKAELEQFGHTVMEKMTQVFVYNKLMTELKAKNFEVVGTNVAADQSVHIHVRHGN